MCKVSDQLKLCSCKTRNIERLKHYWILKRPNGGNESIMGDAILPANIGEDADKINIEALAKMLNSGNCFDTELHHQEEDILILHFTFNADSYDGNYFAYAFVFKNNKWEETDYDPFGANLDDVQKGRVINPFL